MLHEYNVVFCIVKILWLVWEIANELYLTNLSYNRNGKKKSDIFSYNLPDKKWKWNMS